MSQELEPSFFQFLRLSVPIFGQIDNTSNMSGDSQKMILRDSEKSWEVWFIGNVPNIKKLNLKPGDNVQIMQQKAYIDGESFPIPNQARVIVTRSDKGKKIEIFRLPLPMVRQVQ